MLHLTLAVLSTVICIAVCSESQRSRVRRSTCLIGDEGVSRESLGRSVLQIDYARSSPSVTRSTREESASEETQASSHAASRSEVPTKFVSTIGDDVLAPRCTPGHACLLPGLPRLRGLCVQLASDSGTSKRKLLQCWDVCNTSHSPTEYSANITANQDQLVIEHISAVRQGSNLKVQCPRTPKAPPLEDFPYGALVAVSAPRSTSDGDRGRTLQKEIQAMDDVAKFKEEVAEVKKVEYEQAIAEARKAEAELERTMGEDIDTHRKGPDPILSMHGLLGSDDADVHTEDLREFEALEEAAREVEETEDFVRNEQRSIRKQMIDENRRPDSKRPGF